MTEQFGPKIDEAQSKVQELIEKDKDKEEDKKIAEPDVQAETFLTQVDQFQTLLQEVGDPEMEASLSQGILEVFGRVDPENLAQIDLHRQTLEARLGLYEQGITEYKAWKEGKKQVEKTDSLSKMVLAELGLSKWDEDPKRLFSGVRLLQEQREKSGSDPKINDEGVFEVRKNELNVDTPQEGEWLDLKVLEPLKVAGTGKVEDIEWYLGQGKEHRSALPDVIQVEKAKGEEPPGLSGGAAPDPGEEQAPPLPMGPLDPKDFVLRQEHPTGLGRRFEDNDFETVLEQYSLEEQLQIIAEASEAFELTEQQVMRLEQLDLVTQQLNLVIQTLEDPSWAQSAMLWVAKQFSGEEKMEAAKAFFKDSLTTQIPEWSMQVMKDPNISVESLLKGHTFDNKSLYDVFAVGSLGTKIEFVDPQNQEELLRQKNQIVGSMREGNANGEAQALMEQTLEAEFAAARETLEEEIKKEARRDARARVLKQASDPDVLAQWEEQGFSEDQQYAVIKALTATEEKRLLNEKAAELTLDPSQFKGEKAALWAQYNDLLDPKHEWRTVKDETTDMVMKEVLINAPLILVSGGVASVGRMALSAAARSLATRAGIVALGARMAEGGVMAQRMLSAGRLGARATGLLTEGFLFEAAHMGLQGEWILSQPDWVQRTLWSSVSLGAFKFAGGKGAQFNTFFTKNVSHFADKSLAANIQKLIIAGHAEVAAMLTISAIQKGVLTITEGEEFEWDWAEEVMHAYVAVGALKVSHGMISTAKGKLFPPKGGGPGTELGPRGPGRVEAGGTSREARVAAFGKGLVDLASREGGTPAEIRQRVIDAVVHEAKRRGEEVDMARVEAFADQAMEAHGTPRTDVSAQEQAAAPEAPVTGPEAVTRFEAGREQYQEPSAERVDSIDRMNGREVTAEITERTGLIELYRSMLDSGSDLLSNAGVRRRIADNNITRDHGGAFREAFADAETPAQRQVILETAIAHAEGMIRALHARERVLEVEARAQAERGEQAIPERELAGFEAGMDRALNGRDFLPGPLEAALTALGMVREIPGKILEAMAPAQRARAEAFRIQMNGLLTTMRELVHSEASGRTNPQEALGRLQTFMEAHFPQLMIGFRLLNAQTQEFFRPLYNLLTVRLRSRLIAAKAAREEVRLESVRTSVRELNRTVEETLASGEKKLMVSGALGRVYAAIIALNSAFNPKPGDAMNVGEARDAQRQLTEAHETAAREGVEIPQNVREAMARAEAIITRKRSHKGFKA